MNQKIDELCTWDLPDTSKDGIKITGQELLDYLDLNPSCP